MRVARAEAHGGPGDAFVRGSTVLGLASIAGGLLSYVFVLLGTRTLGAAFGPVSVVWSWWALGVAALAFPFQHRMTSTVAVGASTADERADVRRLRAVAAVAALALVVLLLPVREAVFGSDDPTFPVAAGGAVLASAAVAVRRGRLAGAGRDRAAAVTLVGEQVARVVVGAVLLWWFATPASYALALVAGAAVLGVGRPTRQAATSRRDGWPITPDAGGRPGDVTERPSPPLTEYLVAIAVGSVAAQAVLTGAPIVLQVLGGTQADVTALFTTLAVARAPFLVMLGVAMAVMRRFASVAAVAGREGLRSSVGLTVRATAGATVAVGVPAALVGPTALRLVFGPEATLDAVATTVVAVGAVLSTGSLVLVLVQIAVERVRVVLTARLVSTTVFTAIAVAPWGDPLVRVVAAFGVSETVAFVLLAAASRASTRPAGGPA